MTVSASELFEEGEHRPAFFVGAAAIVVGLCLAAWASWTSDDAFISFRYARNLVEGHGLVFNVGERVEGYTNLLWTLWIALGLRLGVGAEPWAGTSGLLSYGAALVLLFVFHLDLRRALPARRATLPLACLVSAVHADFLDFATSGLETAAFTTTVLAGYMSLTRGLTGSRPRPLLSGALFGVASLLRPDGMVFAAVAGAALVTFAPRRSRDALWFALGVGVFWSGATAFRLSYYGQYFPNTYYAKSASLPWHEQGLIYAGAYFHKYWPLLAGAAALCLRPWRSLPQTALPPAPALPDVPDGGARWFRVHAVVGVGFAAVYTYYVVRVGGDFMYARLLIPVTPYLGILFELGLHRLSLTRPIAYLELAASGLALLVLIPRPVSGTEWKDGIAHEPSVYDDARVVQAARTSEVLTHFFRGLPVRVAFLGTEARLMYQAAIPVAIEADTGLTDRTIATQALTKRGRIGHEKRATPAYLVSTRAAHFLFAPAGPEDLGLEKYIPLRTVEFGPVKAWVLHWDPDLMTELQRRGAIFADFPEFLDHYLATIDARSPREAKNDYARFRHFYFEHVRDPRRESAFRSKLGLSGD